MPVYVYFRDARHRVRAACAYETFGDDRVLYATTVLSARDNHDKAVARKILRARLNHDRASRTTRFYQKYGGRPKRRNPVTEIMRGEGISLSLRSLLPQAFLGKIGTCGKDLFHSSLKVVRVRIKMLDDWEPTR